MVFAISIDDIQLQNIKNAVTETSLDARALSPVTAGAFVAFYAFIGFEDMVNVAEEVQEPHKTLPRAIIMALVVSTLIYIMIAASAVLAMDPQQLRTSHAPLAELARSHSESAADIITLIGLFAVINGALIQIIMGSRVLYGMAQHGDAPAILANINATTRTPIYATLIITAMCLLFALVLPILTLATITSFITLAVFSAMHLSLWRIKAMKLESVDGVTYPLWVPVLGFFISTGFILAELVIF